MNDKIKQLWWDIQHYGEILSQIDKSDYDNFYTERTHKYQDEIYKINKSMLYLIGVVMCWISAVTIWRSEI